MAKSHGCLKLWLWDFAVISNMRVNLLNNVSAMVNSMKIKLRSDNRYEGRLTVNQKRKSFYGSTKAEVKNKAKEYLMKVESGYREPKKVLLNDYVEYWLAKYKLNKIEPSSYTRLRQVFENQIRGTIGNKNIGDITSDDIQKLIDEYANPSSPEIKPLSLSGLKKIVHLLMPCLNMAVKEGIIQKNPCDNVILPKESCILLETKQQYSLTDSEIESFRDTALTRYKTTGEYHSRDWIVLLIMLNTGLRVGEMLALEWGDIDEENKLIKVNKTIQSRVKKNDGSYADILKRSTKTKSGVRVIPLNVNTLNYIHELQEYDTRNHISSGFVASSNKGTRKTARNLQRSLSRLVKKAGIRHDVSLHTLRHTFGSVLIRRGVGVEVVSELMGHASITITYNKYIHAIKEEKFKAMHMIEIS